MIFSIPFICSVLVLTSCNMSETSSVIKSGMEPLFVSKVVKSGIIPKFDRIGIVSSARNKKFMKYTDIAKSFKTLSVNWYFTTYTDFSRSLKNSNQTELLWFPFGIDKPWIEEISQLNVNGSLSNKYLLFNLKSSADYELFLKLPIRFDSKLYYYQDFDNGKQNGPSWILKEAFKINEEKHDIKTNVLASFTRVGGLRVLNSKTYIWARRSNLEGKELRAVFERQKLSVVKIINSTCNNMIYYRPMGITNDIMNVLAKRLNFTVMYKQTAARYNWTSIVNSVAVGEFDFTVNFFQHTYFRAEVADLSYAIFQTSLRLYYPKSVAEFKWTSYFNSFKFDAWVFVIFHFLGTGAAMYIMMIMLSRGTGTMAAVPRKDKTIALGKCLYKTKMSRTDTYKERRFLTLTIKMFTKSINFSLRSLVGKRHRNEPDKCSIRLVFLCTAFAGFIIITVYRSMLAATMAITVDRPPVNSLEDVLRFSKKLIVWKDTEVERIFSRAMEGTIEHKIKHAGLLVPVKLNDFDYLKKFVSGGIPNTVLLTWKNHASLMNPNNDAETPYPCKMKDVGKDYEKLSSGILYSKNWAFTKLFNHQMLKLQEEGILDQIYHKYLKKPRNKCGDHTQNISHSDIKETISAFVFLGAFQGLAIIIFSFEWLIKRDK